MKTFIDWRGMEMPVSGGSTKPSEISEPRRASVVQGQNIAQDIYGRLYDARVPVFISLDDPSGLVIDRLVFDGNTGTGHSDHLVTIDSLVELRTFLKHKWGDNEHSYQFPDPENPPSPGDDLYPFWQWLQSNFPGWPDNGGQQPQPGWGGGTPPLTSEPINNVRPSLSGSAFIGQTVTLNDGTWVINPSEIGRSRRWLFDGFERTALRDATSYDPVEADWGARITADVTVENADGSTTAATSNSMVAGGINPLEAASTWELVDGGPSNLFVNGLNSMCITGEATGHTMVGFVGLNATDLIMNVTTAMPVDHIASPFWFLVARYLGVTDFIGVIARGGGYDLVERIAGVDNVLESVPAAQGAVVELDLLQGVYIFTVSGIDATGTTSHVARGRVGVINGTAVWEGDEGSELLSNWQFTALDEFEAVVAGSISGTGGVGQLLTATDPSYNLPSTVTRQWMREGNLIAGATGQTYRVVSEDRGLDITCEWRATNQGRTLVSQSNKIYIIAPPLLVTPPVIEYSDSDPGALLAFESEGVWDLGGVAETGRTYKWYKNSVEIDGATSSTYLARQTGSYTGRVTVTSADGTASSLSSNALAFELVYNKANPVITGTLTSPSTLSCTAGSWGGQPTPVITYQWQRDGVDIVGETTNEYDWTIADDNGENITCVVTSNGVLNTATSTSNILVPAALAPSNTVASTISGGTTHPQTLTCTQGTWTTDSQLPATITYQWKRDGVAIDGATSTTYDWTIAADNNKAITCTVTATNAVGPTAVTTNTITPAALKPVNTALPSISGSTTGPSEWTCSPGTWTTDSNLPITFTYQWKRDGVDIVGATTSTYSWTVADDNNKALTCVVTATNAVGGTDATSAAKTPAGKAPVNTVAPSITGGGNAGQVWTCNPGTWTTDSNLPITYTYQWRRGAANISGATSATYTPSRLAIAGDIWSDLSCRVTATNAVDGVELITATVYCLPPADSSGDNGNYTPGWGRYAPADGSDPLRCGDTTDWVRWRTLQFRDWTPGVVYNFHFEVVEYPTGIFDPNDDIYFRPGDFRTDVIITGPGTYAGTAVFPVVDPNGWPRFESQAPTGEVVGRFAVQNIWFWTDEAPLLSKTRKRTEAR